MAAYFKRISCVAHDLALVMSTVFDKKSVADQSLFVTTKKLLQRFKKSHSATKLLLDKTKQEYKKELTVLLPAQTRWSGHFIMIKRLLKIKQQINEVNFFATFLLWVTHIKKVF